LCHGLFCPKYRPPIFEGQIRKHVKYLQKRNKGAEQLGLWKWFQRNTFFSVAPGHFLARLPMSVVVSIIQRIVYGHHYQYSKQNR